MYVEEVIALTRAEARYLIERAKEKHAQAPKVREPAALVDEPLLQTMDVHAPDHFLVRRVFAAQRENVHMVPALGQRFRITHHAVIALIESVGDHRHAQRAMRGRCGNLACR
jgi:hypothetical protein